MFVQHLKQISMSTFESKTKSVLVHLQTKGSITSWKAIDLYRATRLSAIIFNLKGRGHDITTEMRYDPETKSRWAVYHYHSALSKFKAE